MTKIRLFFIAVAMIFALCQGSNMPPVPMNAWVTSDDFPIQEGNAKEGKYCLYGQYYCMHYVLQDDGCYLYTDGSDDKYTICLDSEGNQASGVYRNSWYVEEFERSEHGYLWWDNSHNTWYESHDGNFRYNLYDHERDYYYEEWLSNDEITTSYKNSDGYASILYKTGTFYEYHSNGDIDYYSAPDGNWYAYKASEDQWYDANPTPQVKIDTAPVLYMRESSRGDLAGGSGTSMKDIQQLKVDIDSDGLGPLLQDIISIEGQKLKIIEQAAEQLFYDLEDSYYNILGEVIINLGRTVVPIGEAGPEILDMMSVNEDCDTSCGAQCFDPLATKSFFMDPQCMKSCGCNFKIKNMKKCDIADNVDDLFEAVGDGMSTFEWTAWDLLYEIQPTIDLFLSEISDIKNEYAQKLHHHAINTFSCEPECSEDCTINNKYYPLQQNRCVRDWCDCTELPITIEPPEDMNLHELEGYFASLADLLRYISFVVQSNAGKIH